MQSKVRKTRWRPPKQEVRISQLVAHILRCSQFTTVFRHNLKNGVTTPPGPTVPGQRCFIWINCYKFGNRSYSGRSSNVWISWKFDCKYVAASGDSGPKYVHETSWTISYDSYWTWHTIGSNAAGMRTHFRGRRRESDRSFHKYLMNMKSAMIWKSCRTYYFGFSLDCLN